MIKITEDDKDILDSWYQKAQEQTLESLPAFLKSLMEDYQHDYGTICHALAAGAAAAARAMNKEPQGGITGFQAGAVMWQFISDWLRLKDKPLSLRNYNDMLYPQYEYKFKNTISTNTWEYLKKTAATNLLRPEYACDEVKAHWKSIVEGQVPFGYEVSDD